MKNTQARNHITAEQLMQLREAFVHELFGHQRKWWDTRDHACRFIINPRQMGATWYFAIEGLLRALETGDNQIFVSTSKALALAARDCMAAFAKRVIGLALCGDPIRLSNGAELYFYGPKNLLKNREQADGEEQQPQGNLRFDQPFWVRNFADLNERLEGLSPRPRWNRTYFGFGERTGASAAACDFWFKGLDGGGLEPLELREGKQCSDGIWRHAMTAEDAVAGGFRLYDLQAMRAEYTAEDFKRLFMCDGFVARGDAA